VRSPPQGGLPPVDPATGTVVEIACDESGFSGTNLLDPATPVFTHASVDLRTEEAEKLVAVLRSGFRLSPEEVKSGRFLRSPGAGEALGWFLTALRGRAHVHVVDKQYFLATRIVDLLLAEPSYLAGARPAPDLRRDASAVYQVRHVAGPDWSAFLAAFVKMVRLKRARRPDPRAMDRFLGARDALLRHGLDARAASVLTGLGRGRVAGVLARLADGDPSIPPPLEPMLPALAETVLFWSTGDRRVLVIHDEQSALTAARLRRLQQALCDGTGRSPLVGLVMVDSRDDARVQVADLLAGVARRWSGDADQGALRPLLSPSAAPDPDR
jgi:hypothetical protein